MGRLFIRSCNTFLLVSLLISPYEIIFGQTSNVPLNHWIYDVLERWETQGYIENVYDHTKPYSRLEVAKYLSEIFNAYQNNPGSFSRYDRQYLKYCASEFSEELEGMNVPLPDYADNNHFRKISQTKPISYIWPKFLYANNRDLLSFHHKEFSIYADIILQTYRHEFLSETDAITTINRRSNGFLFRGSLGKVLGYYFSLTDNKVSKDPVFKSTEVIEESGWPFLQFREDLSAEFDENVAYLTLNHKYFYLLFGRDYNQWGAGHNGNLMLSTNAPIYDQIKLVIQYWRFKLTHITAWMQYIDPQSRGSIKSSEHIPVYWSGNRLEFYFGKGVQLGLAESVVYGNRSLQIGYLNPLAFFKSVEHYYGDRDNGTLSIDFAWRIFPGFKIYGEWFLDELKTNKLGTNWFGNKFGYQAGAFLVDPLKLYGTDLLVEYTKIRPYVYSHSLHDYNKYKHYDTVHGHHIGPNSDDWHVRIRYYPHRRLLIQGNFEKYRHGKNLIEQDINVGGDPDLPFRYDQDSEEAPFLAGERMSRTVIGAELRYEILRRIYLNLRYHQVKSNILDWSSLFSFQISWNFGYRVEPMRTFQPATY